MEAITFRIIFNRKNQLSSKGQGLVQIEAYQAGNRRYFGTGVKVLPDKWKPKPQKDMYVTDKHLNLIILNTKNNLCAYRDTFVAIHGSMTLSDFDGFTHGSSPSTTKAIQLTFTDFYEEQLKIESKNIDFATWQQQQTNLEFLKVCFPNGIKFEELTYTTIETYDQFLKKRKGRDGKAIKLNSVDKRHRQTRKYIKIAIKKGYLKPEQNPYSTFERSTEPVNKVWLSKEEWHRVEGLCFESSQKLMEMARDMFLFSTYTGLRYSDVHSLTKNSFVETEKGLRLKITAQKTNKELDVPLYSLFEGKPEVIAKKYLIRDTERLFYGMTNPKANKLIKEIATIAKINKHITFHDSRDTFGTHAVRKIPVNFVQNLMQHSDLRTTKGYLHLSEDERDDLLEKTNWN